MNPKTNSFSAHRLWQLLALGILGFSLLRGIRHPNLWSYTHFLFNYDYGIVKRGLVGEAMAALGNPYFLTYDFFTIISLLLFVANVILLASFVIEMTGSRNPALLGAALVFVSSLAVVFFAHTIGYLDHVGIFITLIALKIRRFYMKLGFLLLGFPLALFIHEAVLILLFPVNFMSLLLCAGMQERLKRMAWLGVFSVFILALVFVVSENTLEEAEAVQMYDALQADVAQPLRRDAFNVLHRDSQENFQRTMQRWGDLLPELRQSILVTAPSFLFLICLTVFVLKRADSPVYVIALAVLASLSPLLLHLWGWDMHRWNTYTITTSFLMVYIAQSAKRPAVPVNTAVYILIALLVCVNTLSTIPLFDEYYVKQFPFLEHQNYLLDLARGIETFPSIPTR